MTQNKKWGQNFYVLGFWNIKRGHNLFQRRGETQNTKLSWGGGGKDGVQQWKGWMGRWSISMKYFPRLIPLSILKYFVLSKRRIPKIWSRCADLINCATLRQHIFRHIFSKSDPINVFFFFMFSSLKFTLIGYILPNISISQDLGYRAIPLTRAASALLYLHSTLEKD